jgi:hypothetical protein
LKLEAKDTWNQKSATYRYGAPRVERARPAYFEDRWEEPHSERDNTPVVKMGTLFTTIFGEKAEGDVEDNREEKVKFITVIQLRGKEGWAKFVTSYSKRGALVDMFHEIAIILVSSYLS